MHLLIELRILLFALMLSANIFSQGFGVELGYNSAKMKEIQDGKELPDESFIHYNRKGGIAIGFNYDFELSENLYFETGLGYQSKGMEEVVEEEGFDGKDYIETTSLSYLEIPLKIKYNYEIGDDTYIFGIGGFNIGFGLSGTKETDNGKNIDSEDIKFGSNEEDDYKSMDLSMAIGAGILYKNYELRLGFNNSISNLNPNSDDEKEIYNRVFTISLGYRFGL